MDKSAVKKKISGQTKFWTPAVSLYISVTDNLLSGLDTKNRENISSFWKLLNFPSMIPFKNIILIKVVIYFQKLNKKISSEHTHV